MGTEVERLYVLFDADGRAYVKGLADIDRRTDAAGRKMESSWSKYGKKAGQAAAAGLAVITAAAVGIGTAIIKSAASFEYEMSRIKANASGTAAEMDVLRSTVIQLGKDTAFSAGESAQAANELVKAGLDIGQTMAALPGMLDLAAAGELDVAKAAEITANQLKVFRLEATDAGKVADVLALTANRSTTEVNLLGESLAMSGAVAAQANLTIEDTAAALGILANNGLKGSDAGTSLKQMFMQLMGPSDKARKLMESYGIEVYDSTGKMRKMEDILREVADGLHGVTDEERDFALATIFGSDAVRAANILLRDGADEYIAFREEISKTGAAGEIAKTKMDNLAGSWEQLKGSAETLAIQLGTKAIPKVREFVDELTDVLNDAIDTGDWNEVGSRFGEMFAGAVSLATPALTEAIKVMIEASLHAAIKSSPAIYTSAYEFGLSLLGIPVDDIKNIGRKTSEALAGGTKMILKEAEKSGGTLADAYVKAMDEGLKDNPLNINKWKLTDANAQSLIAQQLGLTTQEISAAIERIDDEAVKEQLRAMLGRMVTSQSSAIGASAAAMYAGIGGLADQSNAAADAQDALGNSVGPTTEQIEAQKEALEAAQKIFEGYVSTLEGVYNSEGSPEQMWEDADGSLKKYLKSYDKALKEWASFEDDMVELAFKMPELTDEQLMLAAEQGAKFVQELVGAKDPEQVRKAIASLQAPIEQETAALLKRLEAARLKKALETNPWAMYGKEFGYGAGAEAASVAAGEKITKDVVAGAVSGLAGSDLGGEYAGEVADYDYKPAGETAGTSLGGGARTGLDGANVPSHFASAFGAYNFKPSGESAGRTLGTGIQAGINSRTYSASVKVNLTWGDSAGDLGMSLEEYVNKNLGSIGGGMAGFKPGFGGLTSTALRGWNSLKGSFPGAQFMGGRAARGKWKSDHPSGRAFDAGGSPGMMGAMAAWQAGNAQRLGIKYIIYNRKIWHQGSGWTDYKPPAALLNSGADAWHTRHVHTSFLFDKGGYLPPGLHLTENRTGRPEPILTPKAGDAVFEIRGEMGSLRREINALGMAIAASRGAGGQHIHVHSYGEMGLVEEYNAGMRGFS